MGTHLSRNRRRLTGLLWGLAALGLAVFPASGASAYTIQNTLSVKVHARVNPGGFDKDIPANGRESVVPPGAQTAMLTAEIQTDDYNCAIAFPANGSLKVEYFDEGLGPKAIVCSALDDTGKLLQRLPYVSAPGARSIKFLATGDPQIENGDDSGPVLERLKTTMVMGQMVDSLKKDPRYRGIVITGDLTMNSNRFEFDFYKQTMGGMSRYFYDGLGNHDVAMLRPLDRITPPSAPYRYIPDEIREDLRTRKRSTPKSASQDVHYSWDWADVHFVQLNIYPGKSPGHTREASDLNPRDSLQFLAADLQDKVGASGRPVVLFHHYGADDFSCQPDWWSEDERKAYWDVIAPYNVVAIITGHLHSKDGANENWWKVDWKRPAGKTNGPDSIPDLIAGGARNGGYYIDVEITNNKLTARRYKWNNIPGVRTQFLDPFPAIKDLPVVEIPIGVRKPKYDTVVLRNRFTNTVLYRKAGKLEMGDANVGAAANWLKIPVAGTDFYRLCAADNPDVCLSWSTNLVLGPAPAAPPAGWWKMAGGDTVLQGFVRISNGLLPVAYLHAEHQGKPEATQIDMAWWSAQWKLEPR